MRLIATGFFDPSSPQTQFFSVDSLINLRDHLLPGVWPFLAAVAVCAGLVPLAILVARRTGILALPDERHRHRGAIPMLGGIALFGGFAVAVLLFNHPDWQTIGVLVMSGLAAGLLILDDRRPLPALIKLGLQIGLAVGAVVVFRIEIGFVTLPGMSQPVQLGILAVPISIFWLVAMQNTVNFLDGADGLAAGVVGIVAVTLMLAAAGKHQTSIVLMEGALAGACAGFLFFNFNPAKIFMGDSGAHFLGMALGMLAVLGVAKVAVGFALAVPVLALALPILDTAWAIVRRRRTGVSIATPDWMHLHHRLQAFGLDQRQTCYVFYGATAILGSFGLMLFGHRRILALVIVILGIGLSTIAAERLKKSTWRVPAPGLSFLLSSKRSS